MGEGKGQMLTDWGHVRNAILRAEDGEMKISYVREPDSNSKENVIGLVVELRLGFGKPLAQDFTKDEITALEKYLDELEAEQLKKEEK